MLIDELKRNTHHAQLKSWMGEQMFAEFVSIQIEDLVETKSIEESNVSIDIYNKPE